ncbi:MAG TPA: zinc ribbon domain-containing protein [Gemmatimonadales bacterium]|jgi:predicted RNA-binding Zn-ribbon protein involved in translation (DUF1610 family)
MTDLEALTAALLSQWQEHGGSGGGPIGVSELLDKVLPYRIARRVVEVDASEDYEALVLRLLAEEDDLVRVEPVDAADLARATVASRLPDLDVLQLLRSATVTVTDRTAARLRQAAAQVARQRAEPLPLAEDLPAHDAMAATPAHAVEAVAVAECWSCSQELPAGRAVKFCPHCGADQRDPACPSCGVAVEREWQHCPDCGARLRAG